MRLGVLAWRAALAVGIAYLVSQALWYLLDPVHEVVNALGVVHP